MKTEITKQQFKELVKKEGLKDFSGYRLENSIRTLDCSRWDLTALPDLPEELYLLDCSYNPVGSLPPLPKGLLSIMCWGCELLSFPPLPEGLMHIYADNNKLTALPPLPESLRGLKCAGNALTELPKLPKGLWNIDCRNNPELLTLPNVAKNTTPDMFGTYEYVVYQDGRVYGTHSNCTFEEFYHWGCVLHQKQWIADFWERCKTL
jgi:hypothetical protein